MWLRFNVSAIWKTGGKGAGGGGEVGSANPGLACMGINHYTTAAPSTITNNNYSVARVTTIVQAGSQYADLDPSNLVLLAGILFSPMVSIYLIEIADACVCRLTRMLNVLANNGTSIDTARLYKFRTESHKSMKNITVWTERYNNNVT